MLKTVSTQLALASDTLPEVLAKGNTTGGTDLAVSAGDDITLADNSKVIFGAGSDLSVYSDGATGQVVGNVNVTGNATVSGDLTVGSATSQNGVFGAVLGSGGSDEGVVVVSGATGTGWLGFNNGNNASIPGQVTYNHSTNLLSFYSSGTISLTGAATFANSVTSSGLSVNGTVYLSNLPSTGYGSSSEAKLGVFGSENDNAVNSGAVYNIEWKMSGSDTGQYWRANYITRGGSRTLGAYCTGSTWVDSSDVANKENMIATKYGLATVLSTNPVDFEWKSSRDENGKGRQDIGFIAQEMELIIPEVVSGDEGGKGISYGHLVAVAFKAIQEQQAIIEGLTSRIEALESK
jgi:hypothetical protein